MKENIIKRTGTRRLNDFHSQLLTMIKLVVQMKFEQENIPVGCVSPTTRCEHQWG